MDQSFKARGCIELGIRIVNLLRDGIGNKEGCIYAFIESADMLIMLGVFKILCMQNHF